MCGRYTLTTVVGRLVAERFGAGEEPESATLGRFNVCPTEAIAIVGADADAGARAVRTVRWGLVPPWARELGKGFQPINARSETAAEKPPFAELFARPERRCLVLADGWYEWLRPEDPKGERVPFRYTVDGGEPFAFAGLWGRRRIGGELVHSALILTTRANRVCAPVHDRMPVVLAPEDWERWLVREPMPPEALEDLLVPADPTGWVMEPVGEWVNRADHEGLACIESRPAQGSLF